jgi:hypothetical protein
VPAAQVARTWDTPAAPAPVAPAPAAVEPPRPAEPAPAGSAAAAPTELAAAEPPKPEPPKPEPPKPEPPKPEPPRVAAKPEPPKAAARTEPKKPPTVAARRPEKTRFDPATATPVDPYTADKKIDPNAAYKTGLQQFARGDSNGALATFRASLAANPGYAPTWRGIGMVYEKIGKNAQARTAFQKYLQLAPTAGDAAMIRERMGRLP